MFQSTLAYVQGRKIYCLYNKVRQTKLQKCVMHFYTEKKWWLFFLFAFI